MPASFKHSKSLLAVSEDEHLHNWLLLWDPVCASQLILQPSTQPGAEIYFPSFKGNQTFVKMLDAYKRRKSLSLFQHP